MLILFHAWHIIKAFVASATPYTDAFVILPVVDHIHACVDATHAADRYISYFVRFLFIRSKADKRCLELLHQDEEEEQERKPSREMQTL